MKDNFHLIFLVPCCILYKFVNFVQSSFLFRSSFIVCVYTLDFRLISYNSPIAMGSYQRALMILKMKSKSGFFREKLHVHYVDSKSRMEALSCQRFLTVCSQSLTKSDVTYRFFNIRNLRYLPACGQQIINLCLCLKLPFLCC